MSKEKQIAEMAKHCTYYRQGKCYAWEIHTIECDLMCEIHGLFANLEMAGYRLASDVAREIFEEIEHTVRAAILLLKFEQDEDIRNIKTECYTDLIGYIAELKKKYAESEYSNG